MTNDRPSDSADPPRRKERKEEASEEWREAPAEKFLDEIKGEMTTREWKVKKKILHSFENHLEENINLDNMGFREVVENDVELFITEVLDPDPDKSDQTGDDILSFLQTFYTQVKENNAITDNPVKEPLEDYRDQDERDLDSPDRPYIPFEHMKRYVNWLEKPISRAFVLPGLKHGTRTSEVINIDLRCLNIDHPVFRQIIKDHDVVLDPRVRNKPDSLLIYESFTEGTEIPNEQTPGEKTEGVVRDEAYGNKRPEEGGSVLPIDSELKTTLLHWLLVRPPTYDKNIHPLYVIGGGDTRRPAYTTMSDRIWAENKVDSIRVFGRQHSLNNCPECGRPVTEENLKYADKTGRRYRCNHCKETYWRTITWEKRLSTEQKVTYHQFRHYFSDAHRVGKSEIHEGEIPEFIRKKRIRGDSAENEDTDEDVYSDKQYQDWEQDVRQPYLDAIYKFGLYNEVIPAVGEGWNQ